MQKMLSFDGWSVGITYCLKILIDTIFSIFFIVKAKKNKISMLYFPAFMMIAYLLAYIPYVFDFFNILIIGMNIQFSKLILLWIISGETMSAVLGLCLGSKLCLSKYKKFVIIFFFIFSIITEIIVIIHPSAGFVLDFPSSPGENLIKPYIPFSSPLLYLAIPYILVNSYYVFILVLKSYKLKGKIRMKYLSIALGFFSGNLFFILISVTYNVGFLYAVLFYLTGLMVWLPLYYGLTPIREKKIKQKKTPSDDELKFVSYLMKKPSSNQPLTEEAPLVKELNRNILVFASYSSKDSKIYKIQDIAEKLKAYQGIKDVLFYEGESIDNIIKYMNDNLGLCDAFLLFCSQNALSSVPVEKEWTAAEAMGVPIIPIFFDLKHVPPLLQSRLGVEFDFYNLDQTVKEIYSSIVKKCVERD
jgi:hypothetical protein